MIRLFFIFFALMFCMTEGYAQLKIRVAFDSIVTYDRFFVITVEFENQTEDTLILGPTDGFIEIKKISEGLPTVTSSFPANMKIAPGRYAYEDYDVSEYHYSTDSVNKFNFQVAYEGTQVLRRGDEVTLIKAQEQTGIGTIRVVPFNRQDEYEAYEKAAVVDHSSPKSPSRPIQAYQNFVQQFPQSKLIVRALDRLVQLSLTAGREEVAASYCRELLKAEDLPESKMNFYELILSTHSTD